MVSALLTCMGTRGDVQPFVALGLGLMSAGYDVIVAVPQEFESFAADFGLTTETYHMSMQHAAMETENGKRLQDSYSSNEPQDKESGKTTEDFFLPLFNSWFEDTLRWCRRRKPDLLLLTSWPWLAGCSAIPELCDHKLQAIVLHLIPATPTKEFAQPVAELGLTSMFRWVNSFTWWLSDRMVMQGLYRQLAQQVIEEQAEKLDRKVPQLSPDYDQSKLLNLYIFSKFLVPKPRDWPDNCHVVGPLQLPMIDYLGPLPFGLQEFVNQAEEQRHKVIYIGFGSMLAAHFETEQTTEIMDTLIDGIELIQAKQRCHFIIQTSDTIDRVGVHFSKAITPDAGMYLLEYAFPHNVLFRYCDLIINHGGTGTVHSTMAAGKPMIVIPCLSPSDQAFWADTVRRRGLGPRGFQIQQLTPKRLCKSVLGALQQLDKFTAKAKEFRDKLKEENGVANCVSIISKLL